MSIWAQAFLLTAFACAIYSLAAHNHRGAGWVCVIIANVLVSNAYRGTAHPYPDALMAGLDFAVCAGIYYVATNRWALWLFLVMQLSMLISLLHLGAGVLAHTAWPDDEIYLLALELCNYAAVLLVGGVSGYAHVGRRDIAAFGPWRRFRSFVHPLFRARATGQV